MALATEPSANWTRWRRLAIAVAFLPTAQGILLLSLGYINLFWDSVFGLGWHVLEWAVPHKKAGPIDFLGILGWPAIVGLLLFRLGKYLPHASSLFRRSALMIYALSLLVIVPMEGIVTTEYGKSFSYEWLPLYIRLLGGLR